MNGSEKTATPVMMAPPARLLRKKALADELGVGRRTIEEWMSRGILQPIRLGRVLFFEWNETVERLRTYGVPVKEGANNGGGR